MAKINLLAFELFQREQILFNKKIFKEIFKTKVKVSTFLGFLNFYRITWTLLNWRKLLKRIVCDMKNSTKVQWNLRLNLSAKKH